MTYAPLNKFFLFIVFLTALCPIDSFSADYYWVNGGGSWNDGSHWSNTSGGSPAGIVPTSNDNAIFDEASLTEAFSLIHLTSDVNIKNITVQSSEFISFHGSNVNLTVNGNFILKSKAGFYLGGKIILKNKTALSQTIKTNDIDFYTDIEFESGVWNLNGHLKTANTNTISFKSGTFKSNGYTLHAKNIIANQSSYNFDFTDSHISVLEKFDVSSAENIGEKATYLVLSPYTDKVDLTRFLKGKGDTRDATVFCTSPPFKLDLFITSDYNGRDISCYDSCDGQITVIASGTPGPFSYRYGPAPAPFGASNVFSDLCVGSHSVTVTDSSNELAPGLYDRCTISDDLNEPPVLSFDPPVTINPTCPFVCDGQAFTFPAGGTPPLTVFWPVSGETTTNPVMLCVGENPVIITDINGCEISDIVDIAEPTTIIANPTITPPTCNGDCDAEILLTPSGGNGGPFTFLWSPAPPSGAGSNPGTGFCSGTYDLTVSDVDGCNFDTTITVIDPPVLIVSVDDIIDASCNGSCDGGATAIVVGGVAPYSYEWFDNATGLSTGITDEIAVGFCAGTYFLTVVDALGCTVSSAVFTIDEPTPIIPIVDVYSVSCFGICDGAADVDASGGTGPYTYSWTTVPGGVGVGAADSISGLCPGQYQIIVTDANGCESVPVIVEVLEPDPVTIAITGEDPSCYDLCDGSATAVVSGGTPGYTYSWSPTPGTGDGTPSPSDMCAGIYTLDVSDLNGCDATGTITLNSPEEYDIDAVITQLDCFGDSDGAIDITILAGGSGAGYTYNWFPTPPVGDGTANISGLTPGTWTVTISDSELCDTTISYIITSPSPLVVTPSIISQALCNGDCNGSASVTISGGTAPYTVLWSDPLAQTTLVASGLCAGVYTVLITDALGCTSSASITITQPPAYDITVSQTDLLCFGDCNATATVLVNGGGTPPYTIIWDDPLAQTTFTAIGLCAGTYTAIISDNNSCDTSITFTIAEPAELVVDASAISSSCFSECTGTAFVIVSGGVLPYTYEWYNAATDLPLGVNNDSIFDLCAGDYYAIVTDANGCSTQSIDVTIIEQPEIEITIESITDATCAICDGTAEISATGGTGVFTYDWNPDPLGGDGTEAVTGLCSGSYMITVTDDAGCSETLIVTIDDIALEVLDLDSVDVTCFGSCDGEATANFVPLDPPYTIEWFDNITGLSTGIFGATATGLCGGEYLAVLTNASGCITTEVIVVNEPPAMLGTITTTNASCDGLCDGTSSILVTGGVPPYTYDWGVPLPGGGEGTPSAIGLCAGPWHVDVTDDWGCTITFTTTVNEPSPVIINAESSSDISCFGVNDGTASVIVSGGTTPYTYEWIDCATGLPIGQTGPLATGLSSGSYQCIITDANGCDITSSCLTVDEAPAITALINIENISCYGECDGLISVIPGGGFAPYFFQWLDESGVPIPGQTNDTLNNICSGIYNIRITDLNGCFQIFGPFDMSSPSSPWIVTTSQTNISCVGDCNGTATVVVLDGNNPPYTYLWDDPFSQVTPTANFLCEGTWSVTISDAGVCDTTISFDIIGNDPIAANPTAITNVLCAGECTGEITVNPFGGTAPYTIIWSDGQVGETASGLCSGSISLTITDGVGCTYDTTFIITETVELSLLSSFSNNTSCGVCNGSATVNVSGGVLPYNYNWTPDPLGGEGTNNATGLCAGVVSVLVTDANGCTLTEVFAISDLTGEDVTVTSTDASCFGVCDGTAEAIYSCSEVPCTQEWFDALTGLSTGVTTSSIVDLCEGEYFVAVTNGDGCVTIEGVIINSPSEILPNEIIEEISCAGETDASITLFPSGGSGGGYSYSWSPIPPNGDGTNEALDLGPGIWEVTITDGDGCSSVIPYTIIEPIPITLVADPTNVTCNGYCNGTILVTASGGGGGFTFQWFMGGVLMPGETSSLLAGICPGNYNVEVTDIFGCTVSLPVSITISEPIPITSTVVKTDVLCAGECNGTAELTIGGGVPPYVVNWYDALTDALIGITDPLATGLCPGSYYAVITDNNGCNITTPTVIINEPLPLDFTLTTTNTGCFGFCDGTGSIVVTGGTAPYSYSWLTIGGDPIVGGLGASVSDLCEGYYTVEVTDANGCSTGEIPVVIDGSPEITVLQFSNDANCGVANGNATVFPSGGVAPYTYQWFDASMTILPGETGNALLDVVSGIYFVVVTDALGCSETFISTISDSDGPQIVFDAITNPTCHGECDGSIEITATGINPPLTYTWNPGGIIAEDPIGLCADDYIIEVTDALGCKSFADTTLIDPSEIIATPTITATDCGLCNGAITLAVGGGTGPYSVVWNTGATGLTITDLCSGAYEAEITDAVGCTITQSFTIDNSTGLTGNPIVNSITCNESCDGEVTVIASGGVPPYSYLWLHNGATSNFIDGLCAGTYHIEITDATGCITTVSAELLDPNPIAATPIVVNPSCGANDGSIMVMTEGGILPHTYLWNTGDTGPNLVGIGAGIYTLTITDSNGCTETFTYTINNIAAPIIELGATDIDCFGNCNGTIDTVRVTGGTTPYNFNWFDDLGLALGTTTPLIIDLCAGDYILEVTDDAGCKSYQTGTINQPDSIILNPLFVVNPLCFEGCDGIIASNPIGGSLPFQFEWDDPGTQTTPSATGLCAGIYTVTYTDANGCQSTQSAEIIEPLPITIVIDSIVHATCQDANDGEIYITITGGSPAYDVIYISETMLDTFFVEDPTGLKPMDYYLVITDANGCQYFDTLTVDTLTSVHAYAGNDTLVCFENEIILIGSSNHLIDVTYNWYDEDGNLLSDSSVIVINGSEPGAGIYILEAIFNGCSDFDTVIVTVAVDVFVDAGPDIELYSDQTGTIGGSPTTDPTNDIIWTPIIYLNDDELSNPTVISPQESTWYYITATDTNGCSNIDSVYVEVLPNIVIPDGISPDGDGKNDTWILDFIQHYPGVSIKINVYNRWGDLLFESDETYANDWAGTTKDGKLLPVGTYYYVIDVDHEDFPEPFTGPITIMR